MVAAEPKYDTLRVRDTWLYVAFVKPAERSAGGIWLPEVTQEVLCHARVIAAGPGRLREQGDWRSVQYASPGDHVLFTKYKATPVCKGEAQVDEQDVVAFVYTDEEDEPVIVPHGAWLLVERDEAEDQTASGIVLPEISQRRARRGVIRDVGPGELRTKGPLQCTRAAVCAIMGLSEEVSLTGMVVHWPREKTDALEVKSQGRSCWLIHARDACAVEAEG